MLQEIFEKLSDEVKSAVGNKVKQVSCGPDSGKARSGARIELLSFSPDFSDSKFPAPAPPSPSAYSFCFTITAFHSDYLKLLTATEAIATYFDQKPFMQWTMASREYEMAVSAMDVNLEILNQFWIARGEPHQPVLFFKARVSDI